LVCKKSLKSKLRSCSPAPKLENWPCVLIANEEPLFN
jgi:hypothetical protein